VRELHSMHVRGIWAKIYKTRHTRSWSRIWAAAAMDATVEVAVAPEKQRPCTGHEDSLGTYQGSAPGKGIWQQAVGLFPTDLMFCARCRGTFLQCFCGRCHVDPAAGAVLILRGCLSGSYFMAATGIPA
jgi:hypothetical protein